MKRKYLLLSLLPLFAFFVSCDSSGPYIFPNYHAVGYVIGKEICHIDEDKDYWLVSIFSSSSERQEYGRSLSIDGVHYKNVIKVSSLDDKLKTIGSKVGIEFTMNETEALTIGCDISVPTIYKLKLAEVTSSGPAVF